jgi:glutathione S-transferase
MPEFMQKLEKAVGLLGGSGPALVGSSLSLADATLLVFIKDFFDDKESAKASIAKCPRLQASLEATEKHAGVAKYRASKKK